MPLNFPGPFEVRLNYTTEEPAVIADHQLRLSCQMSISGSPGDPFSTWIPFQKNGSAVTSLQSHVDSLVNILKAGFSTASSFTVAELWEYAPLSFDSVFRSSYAVGVVGLSGVSAVTAGQAIMSFRTILGGIMKVDLRGTIKAPGLADAYPFADVFAINTGVEIVKPESIWWGRDNSYALAPLQWMPGQNEKAWQKVNRP